MPHFINSLDVRATASQGLQSSVEEDLKIEETKEMAEKVKAFIGGDTPMPFGANSNQEEFGTKEIKHTICGVPYSQCNKGKNKKQ